MRLYVLKYGFVIPPEGAVSLKIKKCRSLRSLVLGIRFLLCCLVRKVYTMSDRSGKYAWRTCSLLYNILRKNASSASSNRSEGNLPVFGRLHWGNVIRPSWPYSDLLNKDFTLALLPPILPFIAYFSIPFLFLTCPKNSQLPLAVCFQQLTCQPTPVAFITFTLILFSVHKILASSTKKPHHCCIVCHYAIKKYIHSRIV